MRCERLRVFSILLKAWRCQRRSSEISQQILTLSVDNLTESLLEEGSEQRKRPRVKAVSSCDLPS